MNNIYRKSSLEKLSSPEQLDKMIHITKASSWIALLGMLLMLAATGYWAFFGELHEKVTAEGIYLALDREGGEEAAVSEQSPASFRVLCYVPLSTGKKITKGMKANILPSSVNLQETGFLLGRVTAVGDYGISKEELYQKLGNDRLVEAFYSQTEKEPLVEVEIQLSRDDATASGYAWSNQKGGEVTLSDYTLVGAEIIRKTMAPISKFLGSVSR